MSGEGERPTVRLDPAEEVPSSKGKMDARKGVRRELWQGPRNDTDRMYRMIRKAVTFPGIW